MDDTPSYPPLGADAIETLASIAPVARQSVVDAVSDRLRGDILSGRLRPGTRALLCGFGAGFVWGAGVVEWGAHA